MDLKTKVLVGFSGGVDSTASVILLRKAGYDVTGLYFNVLNGELPENVSVAAKALDLPLVFKDVSKVFSEIVIKNFKEEYEKGRTPNPCIICNPNVKFKTLTDAADELGIEKIATGHYANIIEEQGEYFVSRAANIKKDQSYMLYRLPQKYLKRLILPLGSICTKDEVREIAKQAGAPNWESKDSQDICFIPGGDYVAFLNSVGAENKAGNFVDEDGKTIAPHRGILHYTVGQRKGLGLAMGKPVFVNSINSENGNVEISSDLSLLRYNVMVNQIFFTGCCSEKEYLSFDEAAKRYNGKTFGCKLRYSLVESKAEITFKDGFLELNMPEGCRAPSPGQSAVLYDGDKIIGGGFITAAL